MATITTAKPAGETSSPELYKGLGLFDATTIVMGSMIGSGIFIVAAEIGREVGSPGLLLLTWVISGLMTVLAALTYGELAAMMPRAGGQYVYLRESYGPLWGFLYGWTLFLVIQTGTIAAVCVSFAKFLGVFFPEYGTSPKAGADVLYRITDLNWNIAFKLPWTPDAVTFYKRDEFIITRGQMVAVAVIAFLTILNCRGVQYGKVVQNIFTVAKTSALILLIIVGLTIAANPVIAQLNTDNLWSGATETVKYNQIAKIVPTGGLVVVLMVAGGAMVGSLFSADAW